MNNEIPVLYSFRRCPYAMRARMGLYVTGIAVELREVVLRNKPEAMLLASPKATVPVLVLPDQSVIDESLDIMGWALKQKDPEYWLPPTTSLQEKTDELIAEGDGPFKHHLDRYKYANRYEDADRDEHRTAAMKFLSQLDARLTKTAFLTGDQPAQADFSIFPFVRQFANTDRGWFDHQNLPDLQRWLNNHLTSDIFTTIMHKYKPWRPDNKTIVFCNGSNQTS